MSRASFAANRLIDEIGIRDQKELLLLEEIAWVRGALVHEKPLEGAEARLVVARGRGIITISSAIQDSRRKRFSLAHELGHFEMHRSHKGLSLCLAEHIQEPVAEKTGQDLEQEANEFASSLLLPERFFVPLCKTHEPSLEYIINLANDFSTSITATALRYVQVSDEPVAIVFSHDNRIKWFRGSKDFEEIREEFSFFIDVRARLDPSSLAAALFQGRNPLTKKRKVPASVWFTPGRYSESATITEHSLAMPTYNAVVTLLWIDDVLDDDEDWED